jgi:hypothetical protein
MIKVKDERGLLRDPYSKAILNADVSALEENRRKRKLQKRLHNSIGEIEEIKQRLDKLESLVTQLLNK